MGRRKNRDNMDGDELIALGRKLNEEQKTLCQKCGQKLPTKKKTKPKPRYKKKPALVVSADA